MEPTLCACGCGTPTLISKYTQTKRGWEKGEARRYVLGHNQRGNLRGRKPITDTQGYVREHVPTHPHAHFNGYVLQHRLVMEQKLGRYLEPSELVHHINHVKHDNRPENLTLVTHVEHELIHQRLPHPETRFCEIPGCGRKHMGSGLCSMHFKRQWRHGRLELVRQRQIGCAVASCDRPGYSKGYCSLHYQRMRLGKPLE